MAVLLGATLAGTAPAMPELGAEGWSLSADCGIAYAADDNADEALQANLTLVHNGTSTHYGSFNEALEQAADGDTLQLDADATVTKPVAINKAITLDLAGHMLNANVAEKGKSGAISFTGNGTLTVENSQRNSGGLNITTGSEKETSATSGTYRGIAATGSGNLALEDVNVSVAYTGSTTATTAPSPTLYGVSVSKGSVSLDDTALNVKGTKGSSTYGANAVAGIYTASSDKDARVAVSADSTITVNDDAEPAMHGDMQVPDPTADNLSFTTVGNYIQIFPDKNSNFYQELCEKFKQQAKFDDSTEAAQTGSSSTDSEIYYATPIVLDSGVAVWAFSDPATINAGDLDSIVPTRFFVQSYYQDPTITYGIASSLDFTGKVTVSGQVSATSKHGDAYALSAQGTSEWQVASSDKLSFAAGTDEYRAQGSAIKPTDYYDNFPGSENSMPGLRSSHIVYTAKPVGDRTNVGSKATVKIGDAAKSATKDSRGSSADLKSNGLSIDDAEAAAIWADPDLAVTFNGIRSAQGAESEQEASKKATFGKTLEASGINLPQTAESYTKNGTTYRFVGWSNNGTTYDAKAVQNGMLMNGEIGGTTTGQAAVTFTASYVPVKPDEHLITFHVQNTVLAYAAKDGDDVSYEAVSSDSKPDAVNEQAGYDYAFEGWQTGSAVTDGGKTSTRLPKATADTEYAAVFKKAPKAEPVTIRYRSSKGEWAKTNGLTVPYWMSVESKAQKTDLNGVADKYAKEGEVIKTSTKVYTFTGWGPRVTDTAPLYAPGELPNIIDYDNFGTRSNRFYAKYDTADRTVTVTFMVNGKKYAATTKAVPTTTDFDDVLASTGKKNPANKSKTEKFLGWSLKKHAKSPDVGRINAATLSSLVKTANDSVKLYAVFGSETAEPADRTSSTKSSATKTTGTANKTAGSKTKAGASTGRSSASRKYAKPAVSTAHVAVPNVNKPTVAKSAADAPEPKTASAKKAGALKTAAAKAKASKEESAKTKTAARSKAEKASASSEDNGKVKAAATTTGSNGDSTGTGGDANTASTSFDGESTDNTGNIIGFAAIAAVAAAILGRAVWFFVKRHRGDDGEDEDGIMADKEKVDF